VSRALGRSIAPFAEGAQGIAFGLLASPETPEELRPCAVTALGHLGLALGGELPRLAETLTALEGLSKAVLNFTGKGAGGAGPASRAASKLKGLATHRFLDEWMHRRRLAEALTEGYQDLVLGLARSNSLPLVTVEHLRGIVVFLMSRAALPWNKNAAVLVPCLRILSELATARPEAVVEICRGDKLGRLPRIQSHVMLHPEGSEVRAVAAPFLQLLQ